MERREILEYVRGDHCVDIIANAIFTGQEMPETTVSGKDKGKCSLVIGRELDFYGIME